MKNQRSNKKVMLTGTTTHTPMETDTHTTTTTTSLVTEQVNASQVGGLVGAVPDTEADSNQERILTVILL